MKLVYIFSFISILLESALSIYLKGIYLPLFSVVCLVLIYPFFNNDNKKFLMYASSFGLFYDIVMTDTLFLNFFVFFLVGIIIIFINEKVTNNFVIVVVMSAIAIFFYRLITMIILFLVGYMYFDFNVLFLSIKESLVSNLIYAFVCYLILDYISKRFKINKID